MRGAKKDGPFLAEAKAAPDLQLSSLLWIGRVAEQDFSSRGLIESELDPITNGVIAGLA
jgi:hypothetical protein